MSKSDAYNPSWNDYIKLWHEIEPPWRPNAAQHAFYESYIKDYLEEHPDAKALIFGSTPETRDLCSQLKIPFICFDINPGLNQALNKFRKTQSEDEDLVVGKWEETDKYFEESQFDFVFSDETQNNMPIEIWDKNFADIKNVLKPGGYYFFGTLGLDGIHRMTLAELFQKYREEPEYFHDFRNRLKVFYQLFFGEDCYDWEKRACVFHDLRDKFIVQGQEQGFSLDELAKMWPVPSDITQDILKQYYEVDPPLGEIYDLVVRHFWVDDVYVGDIHEVFRFRRDMVLRPKSS